MRLHRQIGVTTVAAVLTFATPGIGHAAPLLVSGLGVNGWVSGDTRNISGGAANAAQIDAQIKFMGEGQNVVDAAGSMPDASPAGSHNGAGYVRLDGTSANAGKSDISYFADLGGAGRLLGNDFGVTFRHYTDSNTTFRTVGLNISVTNGLDWYSFSYVDPAHVANTWTTSTVSASSGLFYLYGAGAPGGGGTPMTLSAWQADATWGALFTNHNIARIGFNVGSFQRNALVYVDYLETNLLNGGDKVDFVGASVPEPTTLGLIGLGLVAIARRLRSRA